MRIPEADHPLNWKEGPEWKQDEILETTNEPGWRDELYGKEKEPFKSVAGAKSVAGLSAEIQRGLYNSLGEMKTPEAHVSKATEIFNLETIQVKQNLDADLGAAAVWAGAADDDKMIARLENFRDYYLPIAESPEVENRRLELQEDFGTKEMLTVPLLEEVIDDLKLGGSNYKRELNEGMSIVGKMEERGVFNRRRGRNKKRAIAVKTVEGLRELRDKILKKELSIDQEDDEDAQNFIMESVGNDVARGFVQGPFEIDEIPPELQDFLPCRLFCVRSSEKWRLIVNCRSGRTNDLCQVMSPVHLDGPGQVHAMAGALWEESQKHHPDRKWVWLTRDLSDAYKKMHMKKSHRRYAAFLAIRGTRMLVFFARTLFFGSEAAVLKFNIFSRLLVSIQRRALGLCVLAYFDDFLMLVPASIALKVRGLLTDIFGRIFRVVFQMSKDKWGPSVDWCGFRFELKPDGELESGPSERRRERLLVELRSVMEKGKVEEEQLSSVVGKLESISASLTVAGRSCRVFIRPFYGKLYGREIFQTEISKRQAGCLRWWVSKLEKPEELKRKVRLGRSPNPAVIFNYTDATPVGRGVFIVIFRGKTVRILEGSWEGKKRRIDRAEIEAEMQATKVLTGRKVAVAGDFIADFQDNVWTQSAVQAGFHAKCSFLTECAQEIWSCVIKEKLENWSERVTSSANPADRPSRLLNCPRKTFCINGVEYPVEDISDWFSDVGPQSEEGMIFRKQLEDLGVFEEEG